MEFDQGARVFSVEGKSMGRIDRVVINPKTKAITHIVIRTGIIITRAKVVPFGLVNTEEQARLMLQLHAKELAGMPDFAITHYRDVSGEEPPRDEASSPPLSSPMYWSPPYPAASLRPHNGQPQMKGTRINLPAGAVALKEGAKVVSADGNQLGHVERILTSPMTDRAAYLQISKGRRHRERKLVPFEWVDQLEEDQVHLAVRAKMVLDLPE